MDSIRVLVPDKENAKKVTANTIHVGERPRSLSFSGCGFLGVYHIGVASCLKAHAPTFLKNVDRIYGCSAGSIIGAMLLTDVSFADVCAHTMDLVTRARRGLLGPLSPRFKLNEYLLRNLRDNLPDDAHLRADGRLHISLTRVRDGRNVIVSSYASRDELIQVLLCSCFVPFYTGLVPPQYRGAYYIDGGLSNNLPADHHTITVSPWSGSSDICPRDEGGDVSLIDLVVTNTSIQATPSNLHRSATMFFPPEPATLRDFCAQGFRETARYLHDHGLFEEQRVDIRRNPSFSVGLRQSRQRREMTRHMSIEGSLDNFERVKGRRNKTLSECHPTTTAPFSEIDFSIGEDEAEEDQDVLTVVHAYPIHIQKQLLHIHMILPQPVLDALERRLVVGGESSVALPPTSKTFPIDRAYRIALELLARASFLPEDVERLTSRLRRAVDDLHRHFRCRGEALLSLLREGRVRMGGSLKSAAEQMCLAVLLLLRRLIELGAPSTLTRALLHGVDLVEGFVIGELLPIVASPDSC